MEKELRLLNSKSVVGKNWGKVGDGESEKTQGESTIDWGKEKPGGGRDDEDEHLLRASSVIITVLITHFIPYDNLAD